MLSVRGIYDGKWIKSLEEFALTPNVEVIIMFMNQKLPLNQGLIQKEFAWVEWNLGR